MEKIIFLVLIALYSANALSADVLSLNTKGKQYCDGIAPTSFNAGNDINLWLRVDSATSAVIFADAELSMVVATLGMQTDSISPTKLSFSAFSGNSINHISAVGTFELDRDGVIKSVKANMVRRGVINDCYSTATVRGKRVSNEAI